MHTWGRTSLNSRHIPLSVLPVVERSAAPSTGKMKKAPRCLIDHYKDANAVFTIFSLDFLQFFLQWRRKAEKSRMHRLVYFLFAVQIMWFLAVHPSCMFFLVTCCFSSNELWLVLSTGIGFNFQWCPKEWKILYLTTQSWKKLFCVKFVLKYKILTQENLSSKLNWFKLLCVS